MLPELQKHGADAEGPPLEDGVTEHPRDVDTGEGPASSEAEAPHICNPWSWDEVRQKLVPNYVETVSFSVASTDLNTECREELGTSFPDVSIILKPEPCDKGVQADSEVDIVQDLQEEPTPTAAQKSLLDKTAGSPLLGISIEPVAETVPSPPSVNSSLAPISDLTSISSLAESGQVSDKDSNNLGGSRTSKWSPILDAAKTIGMKLDGSETAISSMWSRWQEKQDVKPFAQGNKTSLERFYTNLVTLYILAYHKEESALCFAILLEFQKTNYTCDGLPSVPTSVLAFQFLPENDNLCTWIGTLLAFLWGTQQWQNREDLLAEFPGIDSDAFCKFIFAIARIRDPFTKGLNTAVLAEWCGVHDHAEGSVEEAQCKAVYGKMEGKLNKIKDHEAKNDYEEARKVVSKHDNKKQPKAKARDAMQPAHSSSRKRKAEGPAQMDLRASKRGSG